MKAQLRASEGYIINARADANIIGNSVRIAWSKDVIGEHSQPLRPRQNGNASYACACVLTVITSDNQTIAIEFET